MAQGLEISQGRGSGEAAFLGESSFDPIQNARLLAENVRRGKEKREQQRVQDFSLLNDNVKTKWETDTYNYFEPKINELKSTIIDAFRNQNGELTPLQRMQYRNAWDSLRNEAELSNTTFKSYTDQVQLLDKNPDKFDLEESRANLNILRDPLSNPETKKEVEQMYGGNILQWRADNAEKYTIVPAYSRESFIQELTKGKGLDPQAIYNKAADNVPIAYKTESGTYEYRGKKGVTDAQLQAKVEAIWNNTDRKSVRTKEQDIDTVKQMFIIDERGNPIPSDDADPIAREVLANAKLKGKIGADEIYKSLGKAYTFTDLRKRFPLSDIRQPIANKPVGRGAGSNEQTVSIPSRRMINVTYRTTTGDSQTTETTTDSSISITPTKVTMTTSPRTVDLNGNVFLNDSKVRDIEYGQMDVVPVWKTGPNKGKIVADSFLKNPKMNNSAMIEYTVLSFGNSKEGSGAMSTERSVYTPTSDVIGTLTSKGNKTYAESVRKAYNEQLKRAQELNKKLAGNKPSETVKKKKPTFDPNNPL